MCTVSRTMLLLIQRYIPLLAAYILLCLLYDTRVQKIGWSCSENTNTAKLEYNKHRYSKFTVVTNSYSCPRKVLT